MALRVRIELLGGLRVVAGDRRITRFQTQKTGALLAYLALHPGRSFGREFLAEMLWPDGDSTAVRNRLNQAVSSLRRQLHPPGTEANAVLVADQQTLAINHRNVETDVCEFLRHLRAAERAQDAAEKAECLRCAIDVYGGELYHGSPEGWVVHERATLADQYYDALSDVIRSYAGSGRVAEAIDIANRRVRQDPGEERSHRALMRLYLMAGRPKSALAQFAEMERHLSVEGEAPSLRALALRKEALAAMETVGEPNAEDESAAPTDAATTGSPSTLPHYLTSFIGREEQLHAIASSLAEGRRLITITGLSGMGKTRLAVEAGFRAQATGTHNVGFVSREETDSGSMTDLMAAEADRLLALPGHSALLLADNLDGGHGRALVKLLRQRPGLAVLATSRAQLGAEGEFVMPLPPLPTTEEGEIEELMKSPAIALFIERVRAVREDFQLTSRNAKDVVSLSLKLEGWPLAIEIASGWARSLTPRQIGERIAAGPDILTSRRSDVSPDHRSIRGAIEATLADLSSEQRELFLSLWVFEGGWDHSAAASVCPGADVYHEVSALVDAGLVYLTPSGSIERFAMLGLVRDLAKTLLDPGQRQALRARHAKHYRELIAGSERKSRRRGTADLDWQNSLVALDYLLEHEPAEAFAMATDLGACWSAAGRLSEGIAWMERSKQFSYCSEASEQGLFLTRMSKLLCQAGQCCRAEQAHLEGMTILRAADDLERMLEANIYAAQRQHRQGKYEQALAMLQECAEWASQTEDRWAEARCHLALGNAYVELGRLDDAEAEYGVGLRLGRELQDPAIVGGATGNLGNLMLVQGALAAAEELLARAARTFEEAGDRIGQLDVALTTARLRISQNKPQEALAMVTNALRRAPEDPYFFWAAMFTAASAYSRLGKVEIAAQLIGFTRAMWDQATSYVFGIEAVRFEAEAQRLYDAGDRVVHEYAEVGKRLDRSRAIELAIQG